MNQHEDAPRDLTIVDIAREAGVSVTTVSRILNGKPDVAQRTRNRVLDVIKRTGFTPHAQAQRLRAGSTRTIAVVFPLSEPHSMQNITQLELNFMLGAATAAGEENYFINLLSTPMTPETLLGLYKGNIVDGLVLMEISMQDWRVELLREHRLPFVMIGRTDDNTGLDYVDLDLDDAVENAFDYLVGLGHSNIGFLTYGAVPLNRGLGPAVRSMQGYENAVGKHNIPALYRHVGYAVQDAIEACEDLFAQEPGLTAAVTVLDTMAIGCMRALHDRGMAVPDDFSLVGITSENLAQMVVPALTSIDFSASGMGYTAVKMLIERLQDAESEPKQLLMSAQLIERDSTGSAPPRTDR
ncbi:MAG: LacI family DNA-binding transcriptional regulator [Chloroflexi bacterium]|nr:LacI family DNA-binding transcriptional regulator [Chloroflexota bacterium]